MPAPVSLTQLDRALDPKKLDCAAPTGGADADPAAADTDAAPAAADTDADTDAPAVCPVAGAGCWSRMTIGWLFRLISCAFALTFAFLTF